jgi:GrpB-like predicted nucleotidyltransferase (UPF0157 family)
MQRVYLVPYDPCWPQQFADEVSAVKVALGDLLLEIHHIGSTAIPDIAAKPIIDMLAVVSDVSAVVGRNAQMQELGYETLGEFGIEGRRYFRKDDSAGQRTHQIHAFQVGSPQIERHLAFRDFMRVHREFAEKYDAIKRRLAELHPATLARTRMAKTNSSTRWMRGLRSGGFKNQSA